MIILKVIKYKNKAKVQNILTWESRASLGCNGTWWWCHRSPGVLSCARVSNPRWNTPGTVTAPSTPEWVMILSFCFPSTAPEISSCLGPTDRLFDSSWQLLLKSQILQLKMPLCPLVQLFPSDCVDPSFPACCTTTRRLSLGVFTFSVTVSLGGSFVANYYRNPIPVLLLGDSLHSFQTTGFFHGTQ